MFRLILVTLLCGLLVAQETPQTPPQPAPQPLTADDPVFKTGIDVVSTPALVRDRDGNFVSGLEAKDFRVFDNDKLQIDVSVDVTFIPISLVILIQANSHVQGLLPEVNRGASKSDGPNASS